DPAQAAGFGPISRRWPARRRLAAALDPGSLDGPAPVLGADVDWRYFQAAPEDQRVDFLRGDERLVLEGLHPELPRRDCRLPGARARAWLYGATPDLRTGKEIEMRLDTLGIDVDQAACTLVWRGSTAVPAEALRSLEVRSRWELVHEEGPTSRPGELQA